MNKNNFNNPAADKYRFYHLWVAYHEGTAFYEAFAKYGGKRIYKGLYCNGDKQKCYDKLLNLFNKRQHYIKSAKIYDSQTNQEITKLK